MICRVNILKLNTVIITTSKVSVRRVVLFPTHSISTCVYMEVNSNLKIFSTENVSNNVFGVKLQEQVEERLKFYETGDLPRKNLDVMEVRV